MGVKSNLNPSELDFLALISGSRVDNRPFNIQNNSDEFGSRQSISSGSGFQFGNVQVIENDSDEDQTRLGVPRAINTNPKSKGNNFEHHKTIRTIRKKLQRRDK